jgi:pyruvate,water dikinase
VLARDGRVKRTKLSPQPYKIVADPAGGTRELELPDAEGAAACVTEEQLARLAAVGLELEERLGGPQDIEWAIQGDELFVLQSRPVTA